jgi:hypothetical protein
MDDLLFYCGGELTHALEVQGKKMREAVVAEPEESLKQADVDAWSSALAHHFAVACPELKLDAVWMEPPKDVKIDVARDPGRYFSDYASELARNFPATAQSFTCPSRAMLASSSCGRVRSRRSGLAAGSRGTT